MEGAWGRATMVHAPWHPLNVFHGIFTCKESLLEVYKMNFPLPRAGVYGVFNPRTEAPYDVSSMRVGQSGGTHRGDGRPFLRAQESGQTRRLGIPEAFGLLGLRLLSLHRSGKRIGLYRPHSGN